MYLYTHIYIYVVYSYSSHCLAFFAFVGGCNTSTTRAQTSCSGASSSSPARRTKSWAVASRRGASMPISLRYRYKAIDC